MAKRKIHTIINKRRIRPKRKGTLTIDDIGEELSKVSGMDVGDLKNLIYKLAVIIIASIIKGYHVNLGELGVFGISCDVKGNVKFSWRASPKFQKALRAHEIQFKNPENKGLDDEGFAHKWLEDYPDDIIEMRDSSERTKDDYGL